MRALLALAALCAVARSLAPPTHHALDAEPIVPPRLPRTFMPEAVKTVRAIALHVPKTGGSTVTEYFAKCSTVMVQPDNATAHDMTAAMAARSVSGPRRRDGVLDVLVGMRHPVDRAISAVLWRAGYGERTHGEGERKLAQARRWCRRAHGARSQSALRRRACAPLDVPAVPPA